MQGKARFDEDYEMIYWEDLIIKMIELLFFLINMGVRTSLRAPQLISRALKLTTM
jgi:hypothetical protein